MAGSILRNTVLVRGKNILEVNRIHCDSFEEPYTYDFRSIYRG